MDPCFANHIEAEYEFSLLYLFIVDYVRPIHRVMLMMFLLLRRTQVGLILCNLTVLYIYTFCHYYYYHNFPQLLVSTNENVTSVVRRSLGRELYVLEQRLAPVD